MGVQRLEEVECYGSYEDIRLEEVECYVVETDSVNGIPASGTAALKTEGNSETQRSREDSV